MSKLLLSALLLIPSLAFADTVFMRDGSQYTGTFLQGTSRVVTIIDNAGARRTFNVRDIQQLSFGDQPFVSNPNAYGGPNGGPNPNANGNYDSSRNYTPDYPALVSRLRQDVSNAMNNADLTDGQYQTLQDANETLRRAVENRTYVFDVNARDVRLALNNVVSLFNTTVFSPADRQTVLDDVRQLRQVRTDGRTYPGTSNQNLDSSRHPNQ